MNKSIIIALTYAMIGSSVDIAASALPPHVTFVGLRDFGYGPVAEFRWHYYTENPIFRISLKSLRDRIVNLGKAENGAPHDLSEEYKGIQAIIEEM